MRRRGLLVGLLALVAVMAGMTFGGSTASAAPWSCDAYGYLFQSPNGTALPHNIGQVDLATGADDPTFGSTPEAVNAVGFNILDGFYYGVQIAPLVGGGNDIQLIRIHDDGTVDLLGLPAPMAPGIALPIGDIDPNGHLWAAGADADGDQHWYEVDLAPGSATFGQVLDHAKFGPLPLTLANIGADWAYINGSFYSVGTGTALAPGAHLARFTPGLGVQDVGALPVIDNTGNGLTGFGAVFVDAAGYLYASRNADGYIYRIDPATLQTIVASADGPPSAGNDGARCAAAPIPTITVTKLVDGRVRPGDQFTVGLLRPDSSVADTATTSGAGTTASTVNFPASQGQTYTITDAMAPGSPTPLGEYVTSAACADADGNAVPVGGSGPTWTLLVAQATEYTCTVTNKASADIVLEKSASPTPVVPGEEVTFELKLTNNGPSSAIAETITDQLPQEATFVSASPGCGEAGGTVTCAAGDLAPGQTKTFSITARVASSLDHCLRNSATAGGSVFDPSTANNTSEICAPIKGRADLRVRKTGSRTQVVPGGQVMYTLVVENDGPSDATGVKVVDPMAQGLTLVSANPSQGSCSTASNQLTCDVGKLAAGGAAQVLVTATAWSTLGDITNTACVSGDQADPDGKNDCGTTTVTVVPGPDPEFDLVVRKSSKVKRATVGQKVRYRVVVTNDGPQAAPNVTVKDTLNRPVRVRSVRTTAGECSRRNPLTCELGTIEPGGRVTITIVAQHREAGCPQRNAASASGAGNDRNPDDNLDKVNVCVRKVKLRVKKVASSRTVRAGQTIDYRIVVRNPSRGVARRVRVCDRLPSGLVFVKSTPKAKLRKGQRCWTIKRLGPRRSKAFRVTVRVLPGASGRKVNRATASSRDARATARAKRPVRVLGQQAAGGGVTG